MRTRPGCSGSLPATGWSSSGPNRSASATCSARVMSWSRKNRTLYCSSRACSSANSSASRDARARLMLRSSAPMVAVMGTTSIELAPVEKEGQASRSTVWSTTTDTGLSFEGGFCGSAEGEDGGADASAGLQVLVGADGVLQGVALVDRDGDPPRGDVVEQLAGERAALGRVGDVVGQRRAGDEQRALDGQLHRVDRRDGAGGGAEADDQAAAAQRVQGRRDRGPADAVVGDRDAGAVGQLADPGGD